jgi:S-adenosylmethionine-diacylglycerol 3-amino-3-carboxypropyl transferase
MNNDLTTKAKFDFLRYANCWEDPLMLLEGLRPEPGSKILSIGSAGDNSLSLLTASPSLVVAVDISEVQLHLIRLKVACFKTMTHDQTVRFLGFRASETRLKDFQKLSLDLPAETKNYWQVHSKLIEDGVIHQGKFEKYFQLFAGRILPLIHGKKTVEKLLDVKSSEDQRVFYEGAWDTWRWRLLFRIFFSRYVMGKKGRDPEFLKQVQGSVSDFIYKQAGKHLQSVAAQSNPILRYNLTGDFGEILPHYLWEKNYSLIQAHIGRLVLYHGFAQDACSTFGRFDSMNLSDIFEYMDLSLFTATATELVSALNDGGRMAYWNLMVPRKISAILSEDVREDDTLNRLNRVDNGFFYKSFLVDEKRSL